MVTSNHASTKISVAVNVAARQHRWSRSSSVPVASRPTLSEGLLRPAHLEEAQHPVDDHDAEDDRRIEPLAGQHLDEGRGEQDVDQDVVELEQEARDDGLLLAFRQSVRAVLHQPSGRFAGVEASRRIGDQPTDDLIGTNGMPGAAIGLRRDVDFDVHS